MLPLNLPMGHHPRMQLELQMELMREYNELATLQLMFVPLSLADQIESAKRIGKLELLANILSPAFEST